MLGVEKYLHPGVKDKHDIEILQIQTNCPLCPEYLNSHEGVREHLRIKHSVDKNRVVIYDVKMKMAIGIVVNKKFAMKVTDGYDYPMI